MEMDGGTAPHIQQADLIGWEALNGDCSGVRETLIAEWITLLNDTSLTERDYLAFLHENAGMFFADSGRRLVTISELEFGADLRSDFVTGADQSTAGFLYELIELQSPHDPPYTLRTKQPSQKLTEAITQIQKWRIWLNSNREEARRLFPSKEFDVTGTPLFNYSIIIGRRDDSDTCLHLRNDLAEQMGIKIRSYDNLTDVLRERRFTSVPLNSSFEMFQLPAIVRNKLANPFTKAYSSRTWRNIICDPRINHKHMIAENADILIQNWEYNVRQDTFIRCWNSIDQTRRQFYLERLNSMLKP